MDFTRIISPWPAKTLESVRQGHLYILDKITETIPRSREDYKEFVSRIEQSPLITRLTQL